MRINVHLIGHSVFEPVLEGILHIVPAIPQLRDRHNCRIHVCLWNRQRRPRWFEWVGYSRAGLAKHHAATQPTAQ